MSEKIDATYLDEAYQEPPAGGSSATTPWDIGGPQPVVEQLVAHGAVRGEVPDPGTGAGHHAIHYAAQGCSATGIDISPTAIQRATRNAERAGVRVSFQVADATNLDGLQDRFDTVVHCAFDHAFQGDEERQTRYLQALHGATKPGARLFMFEFGCHNVNGLQVQGLPADNFQRLLPAAGWRLDYLGTTTGVGQVSQATFDFLAQDGGNPDWARQMAPVNERLRALEPLLEDHRIHMPYWAVTATRID